MSLWQTIIGLEIHVELHTESKMFCSCPADHFGKKPNIHCCPVCLGLPGSLPVPNHKAVEMVAMTGMALGCKIPKDSKFDRKNYLYPDLPKGYQISQYDQPFAIGGAMALEDGKKIRIRRVHLEEDTAKLVHRRDYSLIDFNRSGVPLMEIVTEPDINTGEEAKEFLKELRRMIRALGVSSCDMEKGTMRLEVNISLGKSEDLDLGKLPSYKVEIKNLNSFRFVEKAINYEIERQAQILDSGKIPKQETRGWDEDRKVSFSQRTKEEAQDYRYFPEPDIPPIQWASEDIERLRKKIPVGINDLRQKYIELGLSSAYAKILLGNSQMAGLLDSVLSVASDKKAVAKKVADMIINKKVSAEKQSPEDILAIVLGREKEADVSPSLILNVVERVIASNPKIIADYKSGKDSAVNVLLGMVIREFGDPRIAKEAIKILREKLKSNG